VAGYQIGDSVNSWWPRPSKARPRQRPKPEFCGLTPRPRPGPRPNITGTGPELGFDPRFDPDSEPDEDLNPAGKS